jgi:hypothetical protein
MKAPVLAVLAACLGIALWLSLREDRALATALADAAPSVDTAHERATGPAREPVDVPNAELRVRIRAGGKPVAGSVAWVTGPWEPSRHAPLAVLDPGVPESDEVRRAGHDGAVTIAVPAGHFTWLRVGSGPPLGASAFVRVPPFRGVAEREVVLDPARRSLCVQVYRSDWRTPAAGAELRGFGSSLSDPGPLPEPRVVRTDSDGFAAVDGLEPGQLIACAAGAEPGMAPPHAVAVVLPPGNPPTAFACTLVEPEPLMPATARRARALRAARRHPAEAVRAEARRWQRDAVAAGGSARAGSADDRDRGASRPLSGRRAGLTRESRWRDDGCEQRHRGPWSEGAGWHGRARIEAAGGSAKACHPSARNGRNFRARSGTVATVP